MSECDSVVLPAGAGSRGATAVVMAGAGWSCEDMGRIWVWGLLSNPKGSSMSWEWECEFRGPDALRLRLDRRSGSEGEGETASLVLEGLMALCSVYVCVYVCVCVCVCMCVYV